MAKITNNVSITDQISASMNYAGYVTITYLDKYKNKIKIEKHNTAHDAMFTAITRALAGLPLGVYMPTSIMGYYNTDQPAFTQNIAYSTTPSLYKYTETTGIIRADGTDNNIVEYLFMVPINNLTQRKLPITSLKLFNAKNQECASVTLDSTGIDTNVASSIMIQWKLKIANAD